MVSPTRTWFGEQAGPWSWRGSGGTEGCWCQFQGVLASNGSPRQGCEQEWTRQQTGREFTTQAMN